MKDQLQKFLETSDFYCNLPRKQLIRQAIVNKEAILERSGRWLPGAAMNQQAEALKILSLSIAFPVTATSTGIRIIAIK